MAHKLTPRIETVLAAEAYGDTVTVTFPTDGQVKHIRLSNLDPAVIRAATLHGLKQKLADSMALPCDPETGKPADIDRKLERLMATIDMLETGHWTRPAGARETTVQSQASLLAAALELAYPAKAPEALQAYVKGLSRAEVAALLLEPRMADAVRTVQQRTARTTVDTDKLLAELDGAGKPEAEAEAEVVPAPTPARTKSGKAPR